MVVAANVNVVGLNVAMGALAAEPVPESATVCGLPAALSATLRFAARAPTAFGANFTLIAQLALAARLAGHVLVWVKSAAFAPVMEIPVIVSAALPVFVSVTVWAALVVPTLCDANVKVVGERLATGALVPLAL